MANVSYKLKDLEKCTIKIGYVGENEDMHVLIDCKEVFKEYPNAVATMAIVPPEGEGYPKTVTRDGNVVEWLVTNSDVTVEGDGEFQLTFTEGEVIKKSTNGRFRVIRSISGSGEAPSGIQDWLTDANEKLAEVEQATQDAEAAASHQPYIGIDGYWYTWNGEEFVKNVKAQGEKGDPGDPTQLIDDTAGEGQTGKTWSADKLDGEFTDVLNAIQGVEENVKYVPIQMAKNKYIDLSGDTISMSEGHPAYSQGTTSYSCGYISCEGGDVFVVTGSGGNATRLWAFVDEEGVIVAVSNANTSENQETLIAPNDSAWLIVHTSDDSVSYKGDTLDLIKKLYIYKKNEETISKFEQGSINGTTGSIIESTTRIHTLEFIPIGDELFVEVGSNIKWSCRFYSSSGLLVGAEDVWSTKDRIVKKTGTAITIRINIAYKNDDTITPNDDIYVKTYNIGKEVTDKTLSIEGKIADAQATGKAIENLKAAVSTGSSMLGNASIRAAKTLNFADGTPPLIDWYLIQTVDSKFYRTKDFLKKEYLFTTIDSGMAGYVADWSCAILPNNDVLFVADAAGLSTYTHGRLSDENRRNPIIFLASENYAKAHIIDFGTSLKPCGWLNNVGFCTLPNGDIVFAEYTRGTVKTANVWKISGDATDPTNWTVTWSVNIIDTKDTTTPGTKHCHEVMYDFFTGVLYFGTGDSASGSNNFYSTDNGDTWNTLYSNDRNRCRRLNFVFTEDKVYWASDSYQEDSHHFFVAERDNNGIIDVENATEISLISGNGQACYGCVYLKSMNLIVMMDRIDVPVTKKLDWYCYDLETETVEKIGEIGSANNTLTALGFRCRFMDFYPVGNEIITGFSPRTTSANEDTNQNKLCGNQGGSSGDGSTRINNLLLYVYKNGTDYSYRAKTMWI